jgi:lactobin A/cerein 7B family class IIb bacteriocin
MQELTKNEVSDVSGGMSDWEIVGLALIGVAVTAATGGLDLVAGAAAGGSILASGTQIFEEL